MADVITVPEAEAERSRSGRPAERQRLAVYVRDHFAGAAAGLALARRLRENNLGTSYEGPIGEIEAEIRQDRDILRSVMAVVDVEPSRFKAVLGMVTERVARLKRNGRLVGYSESSRVVELEMLAAGVATKQKLWRALRVSASMPPGWTPSMGELERRATDQLERLAELHDRASIEAFGPG